ncbi:undecaprenyl-diphosphatase, partial [Chroococcidiopsidales cyanobacterium LEGE 13417]|nr:undecaprenyl-diphosphatase [Chroococcidiopsidales cyanobacterium LEGE 13417]
MALLKRQMLKLLMVGVAACAAVIAIPIKVLGVQPNTAVEDGMNLWQSFCLGIIQGLTEFLPISSTAHLKVVPVVLGWGDPGVAYTAVIQLGSLAAVLWYFWKDLAQIVTGTAKAIANSDYDSREFGTAR